MPPISGWPEGAWTGRPPSSASSGGRASASSSSRHGPDPPPSWSAKTWTACPSTSRSPAGTGAGGAAGPFSGRRKPSMILVQDLVKRYGVFTAVDGVSLEVAKGEIHGFLGPNGAGKTTTIRIIAGLLKPTQGRIVIDGHDLAREPE